MIQGNTAAPKRQQMASQQIKIELRYERHNDGRYYVTSDDVPGFRMAGADIDQFITTSIKS